MAKKPDIQKKKSKTKDSKEEKEQKQEQSVQFGFAPEREQQVADMIGKDYETDLSSRAEFMAQIEEVVFLYEGKRKEKSDPWVDCSNVNSMITAIAVELVTSKLMPLYDSSNITWECKDFEYFENKNNIEKFMSWVVRDANIDKIAQSLIHDSVLIGTTAHKVRKEITYKWVQRKIPVESEEQSLIERILGFLPGKKKYRTKFEYIQNIKRVVDNINIEDILWNYDATDEQTCDNLIHRFYRTLPKLKELQARGHYKNIGDVGSNLDETIVSGKKKEDMDAEGMRKIATEKETKPLLCLEWQGWYDYNDDDILEQTVFTVHYDPESKKAVYLSGKPLSAVSRIEKRNIIIGQYIKRTNRLIGKGLGQLVMNLQKELDSIYNQKIDAGTVSLIPFGFYTPAAGFDPDKIVLSPGSFYPVDDVTAIRFVTIPNNTLASWQDIRFIISLIERVTSATPYLSGRESEVVGSGATATGTVALIQEGHSMFAKAAKGLAKTIERILETLFESYQEDMPPGLAEKVVGVEGKQLFPEGLSPEDIAGDWRCHLVLDPMSFNRSLQLQTNLQLYGIYINNPIVMSNPSYFWELSAMLLRSSGKTETEIEKLIGKRPETDYTQLDDAREENMQIMAGYKVEVDMREPLFDHLVTHLAFRSSEAYKEMEPEHQALLEEHIEDTKLALMTQMRYAQMQGGGIEQGIPGSTGGTAQGFAQQPGMGGVQGQAGLPQAAAPVGTPAGTQGIQPGRGTLPPGAI